MQLFLSHYVININHIVCENVWESPRTVMFFCVVERCCVGTRGGYFQKVDLESDIAGYKNIITLDVLFFKTP